MTESLLVIFTAAGVFVPCFLYCLQKWGEMKKDLHKSQYESVNHSVNSMLQVIQKMQSNQDKLSETVQSLSMSLKELEVKFSFFIENLEKYYRGPIIDGPDGKIIDPRKVNKR